MIGKTLQHLLDEKGTNVNELAKIINVSPQTLYSIIKRDNMKIDFEILLKICSALNVEVERFYQEYISEENLCRKNHKQSTINLKNYLSSDETDMIEKYRLLDDRGKAAVQETVNREYSYVTQKTVNLSDTKKTGRTQTVRIASRNGPNTLTLNEEQLKAARELLKKIEENPDPDIDDDLI